MMPHLNTHTRELGLRQSIFAKLVLSFLLVFLPVSLLLISLNFGDIEHQLGEVMGLGMASRIVFFLRTSFCYYLILSVLIAVIWFTRDDLKVKILQAISIFIGISTTLLACVVLLKFALLYLPFSSPISKALTNMSIQNM